MKKNKIIVSIAFLVILTICILPFQIQVQAVAKAVITTNDIVGKEFYIKNAYTGQYMDVAGGSIGNGINVWQYHFNGSNAQKWYITQNSDGTYSIYSKLGSSGTNYTYALDISGGSSANDANVQVYTKNGTDAQKFNLQIANDKIWFVIKTKISNYTKAVVLAGPTFNQGGNINQYTFQNHTNEFWILEPVVQNRNMGVAYAQANFDHYLSPYPDTTSLGGDCANFVSQCLLASGKHQKGTWFVNRKNGNYQKPTTISQLNDSWGLSSPSPWISARHFAEYWILSGDTTVYTYKCSDILNNPSLAWNLPLVKGDVIQVAYKGSFGTVGDAHHTMFITDYDIYDNNISYILTYHSNPMYAKNLLQICKSYPNDYFIFYHFK